jgi:hypothetical protein
MEVAGAHLIKIHGSPTVGQHRTFPRRIDENDDGACTANVLNDRVDSCGLQVGLEKRTGRISPDPADEPDRSADLGSSDSHVRRASTSSSVDLDGGICPMGDIGTQPGNNIFYQVTNTAQHG